jgi:branched-chain amino acid transport system permease protein
MSAEIPAPRYGAAAVEWRRAPHAAAALLCLLLLLFPLIVRDDAPLTILCQIEIAAVFALSYNMLLGETGLFSLGHAIFMGLGGFVAVHWLRVVAAAELSFPLPLLPLVGAAGGLAFGLPFGWLATRRSGTAFIMITLGFGELLTSSAFILTDFFGGEAGVSGDRTSGLPLFGWDFGPQVEVYFLTTLWAIAACVAIYALRSTPLGRLANAARDSADRLSFVGYNPKFVYFLMFVLSATFAGVAGALAAINYEIVTSSSLGFAATSMVIVMVYVGGKSQFAGPILGAALITLAQTQLSLLTGAWMLYLGILFMLVILFAPDGLVGAVVRHMPVARAGLLPRLLPGYLVLGAAAAVLAAGGVMIVEMTWRLSVDADKGPVIAFPGMPVDATALMSWVVAAALCAIGAAGIGLTRPRLREAWQAVHAMLDGGRG